MGRRMTYSFPKTFRTGAEGEIFRRGEEETRRKQNAAEEWEVLVRTD